MFTNKDIDPAFRGQISNLIEGLLRDKIFQIKEINGVNITSTELFEYFKVFKGLK